MRGKAVRASIALAAVLLTAGGASADPTGLIGLAISGPTDAEPGVTVPFTGLLSMAGAVPLPLQTIQWRVGGVAAGTSTTELDGSTSIGITFGAPGNHEVRAFAHDGTALATGSNGILVEVSVPELVINEVDYDQPSTDTAEFVELRGEPGASLSGVELVLVNGATGIEYHRIPLDGFTLGSEGHFVIKSPAVSIPGGANGIDAFTENGVQNGAPDGLVLINAPTATVLDTLAYEGAMQAEIEGVGLVDLVEGSPVTAADDGATASRSLSRLPDGADSGNDSADWGIGVATPGSANTSG